jgi:hypothetical protein
VGFSRAGKAFALIVASAFLAPASASAATLYDQLDNQAAGTGSTTPSYFYENGTGDEQAADDFMVPAGQAWQLTEVRVPGPTGPGAYDYRVTVFSDAGNRPGGQVFLRQASVPLAGPTLTIALGSTPQLQPSHYWISVQLMNLFAWAWQNRTVLSGSPAMWQNPDGSDGKPECITWNLRTTCESETFGFPDQAFSLQGNATPLPPPAKKKKCKKHKKHKRSAESAKKKKCKKKKKR